MQLRYKDRPINPIYTLLGWAGAIAMGTFSWSSGVTAQSQPSLESVCIAVKSLELTQRKGTCCQSQTKRTCLKWEQAFPASKPSTSLAAQQRQLNVAADRETLLYGQQAAGSGGSAKDAVIHMGVSKALDALSNALPTLSTDIQLGHKTNFFQRLRRDYQRVFGPRSLGDRATLTPKLDVGVDVGSLTLSSMKAGVQIEF
ncbi:MAG: hypothetical protein WCD18_02315 [Thermosynechococcaceae cyanobacterium]